MTPPQAPLSGSDAEEDTLAAVSLRLTTLTKRADFLRAARAHRVVMPGFVLQMRRRNDGEADGVRVGYTCSKKVGNAVARNRAKRRLREIARPALSHGGQDGHDYVLIGRADVTAKRRFSLMQEDFVAALRKLHSPRK